MERLINQIDHVLIQTKYAKETFVILSEILDLPMNHLAQLSIRLKCWIK